MEDDELTAERVAAVVGPSSAAAQALEDLRSRRERGELAGIWKDQGRWVVGPAHVADATATDTHKHTGKEG